MRISDWSSDVCSSALAGDRRHGVGVKGVPVGVERGLGGRLASLPLLFPQRFQRLENDPGILFQIIPDRFLDGPLLLRRQDLPGSQRRSGGDGCETRSEEHTSELQSLMSISYAVFCLKKKTKQQNTITQQLS